MMAFSYPEATCIPLCSTDVEHIAEDLGLVIPKKYSQIKVATFQLLTEVYQSAHIQLIRTSPYHSQTDGLIEHFNQKY